MQCLGNFVTNVLIIYFTQYFFEFVCVFYLVWQKYEERQSKSNEQHGKNTERLQ